ncbi:MAG: glycosyltransferase family 2 protein [Planctomycetes bacterium]|nr:glycosyltransferase family 2 protein [Planctomycetota bacterium]
MTFPKYEAADAARWREEFLRLAEEAEPPEAATPHETRNRRVAWLERLLGAEICRDWGLFRLPSDFLLSVVIPVYNEAKTIERVIERVRDCGVPCEIVLVDDASTDGAREVLMRLSGAPDLRVVLHERNQGKGAAIRTGFQHVRGDVVVIQDADLEYDPREFRRLAQPIIEDRADVVYGSRFSNTDRPVSGFWHQRMNQFITFLSNLRTDLPLTDVETCYKMFRRELIDKVAPTLRENRFGIEIELTAKLARRPGVRFYERPISYAGRSYSQGKKITWRDGLWALWCILRY